MNERQERNIAAVKYDEKTDSLLLLSEDGATLAMISRNKVIEMYGLLPIEVPEI